MNFNAAFMIIHHLDSVGFYILIFSLFIFILLIIFQQAEGQNAKNQQMDPFTRRQCKPTMVSNVSIL